jgi:hypothetical protein
MNKPFAIAFTIFALMVVAYIAMAVNYKEKSGPVIIVKKTSNAWPGNKWAPANLGVDSRMWTPTVFFKN